MHPAEMSDCIDDLNTPDVTVTCQPHVRAPLTALLDALTDIGNLRDYSYSLETAYLTHGDMLVSGRSAPVIIVRAVLEGLGYTVRVTQVVA
jgi:hypothetical protein